jgi:hypothetical protein
MQMVANSDWLHIQVEQKETTFWAWNSTLKISLSYNEELKKETPRYDS